MKASQNNKAKLIYLLEVLYENTDKEHGLTMPEILKKLEEKEIITERRSIYRDISLLNECGLGIEKKILRNETFYYIGKRLFSLAELKLLADSIAASKLITKKQAEDLVKKIESLTSRFEAVSLAREVYIEDRAKTENTAVIENIGLISKARKEGLCIDFEYLEWNHEKKLVKRENGDKKDISPCFLELYDGNYYMIALEADAQKPKHYRVDKMSGVKISDKPVNRLIYSKELKNPALYSAKLTGMYSGPEVRLKFEVPEKKIGILIDHFGAEAVMIPQVREKNGNYVCFVDVEESELLFGWIMGVSGSIKLAGPKESVERYRALLKRNLEETDNGD